eukprot:2255813-Amphidinium_carterae.1
MPHSSAPTQLRVWPSHCTWTKPASNCRINCECHAPPRAWAAAWDAAHAAGLGQDAIHFGFRNPRSILRRDALGSDAVCSAPSRTITTPGGVPNSLVSTLIVVCREVSTATSSAS